MTYKCGKNAPSIMKQGGSGGGHQGPLSYAGQHPASPEHPYRPQGGALEQLQPTSGP